MHAEVRLKLVVLAAILLLLIVLALGLNSSTWEVADFQRWLTAWRERLGNPGSIWVIAGIMLASIAAVPLGLIIAVVALLFGPLLGALLTLSGATIGAAISYGLGSYLGHDALCRFAGDRVNRYSRQLGKRGILAVIVIRLLPIAPFAIVNMVAGTTHVRWRDFLLGTVIGMIPGVILIGYSVEGLFSFLFAS